MIKITRKKQDFKYSNSTPIPQQVGGYEVGTTFLAQTLQQLWDGLLYPYQYPAFNAFSFGQSTPLECGISIAAGNKTWTWGTTNQGNINANSLRIDDITNSINIGQGLANDGSELLSLASSITKTTHAATNTFRITGTNSKNQNFIRDNIITWYAPSYYGVGVSGLPVSSLQALSKRVVAKSTLDASFTTSNQKIYFAYPASWGALTIIKDPNLFDITSDFTRTTKSFINNPPNYNGVTMDYYVYEYNNLTTLTNFTVHFIF